MAIFRFFESFFGWCKQIFLWAYNTLTFTFPVNGQLITIKYLDCVIAILVISIVISVFWRSGKW